MHHAGTEFLQCPFKQAIVRILPGPSILDATGNEHLPCPCHRHIEQIQFFASGSGKLGIKQRFACHATILLATEERIVSRRGVLRRPIDQHIPGIAAARSALGHAVDYQPLPWFWSDQYDMNLQIYGMPTAAHRVVLRGDQASGSFVLFYLAGNVVQAAIGPNSARDLRFARRLIEQRKPVDDERLADLETPMSKL